MKNMQSPGRLEGLDLARYLAFVGMVIVNFQIAMGAESGAGFLHIITAGLQGRAAATFVVLAGIGLGLAHARAGGALHSVTIKRAVFLLVIGLMNMTIFDADILHYYAFYFFFGVLLLPLGSKALIGIIAGLNLAFVIMILALNFDAGWNWGDYSYSGFWTPIGFVRNLFFNGWHPVIPWLGFFLFGILLSRLPLGKTHVQTILIVGGAVVFGFAEGANSFLTGKVVLIDPALADLTSTAPVPPMPLYTLAGGGAACFIVGLCLILSDRLGKIGVLSVVAPAGRQTLTLYIAHILVGMVTLDLLGMLGGQTVGQAFVAALVFCAFSTIYALIWARWFPRGPVEALMRKLAG